MKDFWLDVLKRLLAAVIVAIVLSVVSLVVFSYLLNSALEPMEKETPDGAMLVLDLSMNLTDRPSGYDLADLARRGLSGLEGGRGFHLLEVLRAIHRASEDESVKGLFLKGSLQPEGYGCGYAALAEVGEALLQFRKSGKPVLGYLNNPTQRDYFLYSHADKLYLNPYGTLILNGMAAEVTFYGKAFEEYGVGAQVARTGEYKGAVEPFLGERFSEPNREQLQALLDDRWSQYLERVAANRRLDFAALRADLRESFVIPAERAVEIGLADEVSYYDEMLDLLAKTGTRDEDTGQYVRVSIDDYVDRPDTPGAFQALEEDERPAVAVVYLEGSILDGNLDDGTYAGGDLIASRLREVRADERTRAIVLRVNSPGGSVTGSEAVRREIVRAREDGIPVVASMGAMAASGGYWVSAPADLILARPETVTGSIGVFGLVLNVKELGNRFGLTWDVVKTEPHADALSFFRPKTEEEMDRLQDFVDDLYERFLAHVAASRGIDADEVDAIARGRVWSGEDALELGLVDEFGGLVDALAKAAELGGVAKEFQVIEYPRVQTPVEALAEFLAEPLARASGGFGASPGRSLAARLRAFEDRLSLFLRLNDPRHAYALFPWFPERAL